MVSFYGMTPSGFDFEIGAAGQLIDRGDFKPIAIHVTSDWVHDSTVRVVCGVHWGRLTSAVSWVFILASLSRIAPSG